MRCEKIPTKLTDRYYGETRVAKVMIIDDDEKLCAQISRFLTKYQFEVSYCHNGSDGIEQVAQHSPDIVVLDLMLPGCDGFEVCRMLRRTYHGRIVMLTASDDDMDHVVGIEMGADDFLVKPIHPRILLARIKLLLRRDNNASHATEAHLPINEVQGAPERRIGALNIHLFKRQVHYRGQPIVLTTSEFDLLDLLSAEPNQVHSRDKILRAIRGIEYDGLDRSIDVKIAALRKKLGDDPKSPKRFLTLRGQGYMFVQDEW